MTVLWSLFWPVFAAGLVIGTIAGPIAFPLPKRRAKNRHLEDAEIVRAWRKKRRITFAGGAIASLIAAAIWCGPLGAANRFSTQVEQNARQALDYYEMTRVTAHLNRHPLTRDLTLAGPADDFQSGELVRLLSQLPGVNSVSWTAKRGVPLIVESGILAIVGFLIGLVLAYLVELRRRYNAQWNW